MRKSSVTPIDRATRTDRRTVSQGQKIDYRAIGDACARMGRRVRGVPKQIQNVVYGLTRRQPRTKEGHLLGKWVDVAFAFAEAGSPLIDVMAPAYEVESQLRRGIYRNRLPSLVEAEAREADAYCLLRKAEITNDPVALRQAVLEERAEIDVILDVVDQSVTPSRASAGSIS